jgi:hypothetical protein
MGRDLPIALRPWASAYSPILFRVIGSLASDNPKQNKTFPKFLWMSGMPRKWS